MTRARRVIERRYVGDRWESHYHYSDEPGLRRLAGPLVPLTKEIFISLVMDGWDACTVYRLMTDGWYYSSLRNSLWSLPSDLMGTEILPAVS